MSFSFEHSSNQSMDFPHHNYFLAVKIKASDYYDIKNLIMMQKACGLLTPLNWTRGQGKCGPGFT